MIWRFIDTGYNTGTYNMAVDEALMKLSSVPVLRIYGWKPYAVSIGYAQKMDSEVDPMLCKEMGYDFVRRPTGGRAVFHSEEMTYSVIADQSLKIMGNSTLDSYKTIAQGLANALWEMRIEAELQKSKVKETSIDANPCFTSAGRYEILVNGKKIIGSAQRRSKGKILQHGSLLTGPSHLDIVDVMPRLSAEGRRRMRNILIERTTTVFDELRAKLSWKDMGEAMKVGFQKGLNIELIDSQLSHEEQKMTVELMEKYHSDEWNFKRQKNTRDLL